MPASAASEQPSAHDEAREHAGAGAVEGGERAVVDDRPHRDAEPGAEQQEHPQPDRQHHRDDDRDEPVPRSRATSPALEAAAARTGAGRVWPMFWSQIMFARPMNANIRPTVTIELHDQRLALQVPHDRRGRAPTPKQRRDDEHDDGSAASHDGQPQLDRDQLPVHVRRGTCRCAPWAKLKMPVVV